MKYKSNIGADFIDGAGTRIFSFQVLLDGQSHASLTIYGDKVGRFFSTNALKHRRRTIERLARIHMAHNKPQTFSAPTVNSK